MPGLYAEPQHSIIWDTALHHWLSNPSTGMVGSDKVDIIDIPLLDVELGRVEIISLCSEAMHAYTMDSCRRLLGLRMLLSWLWQ